MRAIPVLLGAAAVVMLVLIDAGIVVAVLAFLLVVVLPGGALTSRLLPTTGLGAASRTLVVLGMGLSLVVLLGIALDQTALGLRAVPVVLAAIGLAWAAILAWPHRRSRPRIDLGPLPIRQLSLFALSLFITVTAFGVARIGVGSSAPTELTQLWILRMPDDSVQTGVHNGGTETVTYRLVLQSGTRFLMEWTEIDLEPGATWQEAIPPAILPEAEVRAILYRADELDTPFREVVLSDPRVPN